MSQRTTNTMPNIVASDAYAYISETQNGNTPLPNSGLKKKKHRSKAAAVTIVDGFFSCAVCKKCINRAMIVGKHNAKTFCSDCYLSAVSEAQTPSTVEPSTSHVRNRDHMNIFRTQDSEPRPFSDVSVTDTRLVSFAQPPSTQDDSTAPHSSSSTIAPFNHFTPRNEVNAFGTEAPRMVDALMSENCHNTGLSIAFLNEEPTYNLEYTSGTTGAEYEHLKTKAKRAFPAPVPATETKEVKVFFHSRLPSEGQMVAVRDLEQLNVANLAELYTDNRQSFDERKLENFMVGALCPALVAAEASTKAAFTDSSTGTGGYANGSYALLQDTSDSIWEINGTPETSESQFSFSRPVCFPGPVKTDAGQREYENALYRGGFLDTTLRATGYVSGKDTQEHVMNLFKDRIALRKSSEWNKFLDERILACGKHSSIQAIAPHEVHVFVGWTAHDCVVTTPPLRLHVESSCQKTPVAPCNVAFSLPREHLFISHLRIRALFGWQHQMLFTPLPPCQFAVSHARHQFEILRMLKCISSTTSKGDRTSYSNRRQEKAPVIQVSTMESMSWFGRNQANCLKLCTGDDDGTSEDKRETVVRRKDSHECEPEIRVDVKFMGDVSAKEKLAEERSTYRLRVATRDCEVVHMLHSELMPTH